MNRTTLISVLFGIFLTLSVGFEVYKTANQVAGQVADKQTATVSAMFGGGQ